MRMPIQGNFSSQELKVSAYEPDGMPNKYLMIEMEKTNLLVWAPLRLVSITIIENKIPEKPIAHSFMR